jgi:hypothetical protein
VSHDGAMFHSTRGFKVHLFCLSHTNEEIKSKVTLSDAVPWNCDPICD